MDPVTATLLTAFVLGAANGAAKVGEQSVCDAYNGLKHLVTSTYGSFTELLSSIASLEAKPDSQGRRDTLAEELISAGLLDSESVLAAAEAVIAAAERTALPGTIGIDWEDVRAVRLKIGEIRARAGSIAFRAARMEISGEVEIARIDTSGAAGK